MPLSACSRRLSNSFWLGCSRPASAPNSEPRCSAKPSRSMVWAPRAVSMARTSVLPGPGGPVDQHHPQRQVGVVEARGHLAAIGPVAARQQRRAPAHLGEDRRHGVRALAAAPAVEQRREGSGQVDERRLQVARDIAGDVGGADLAGPEARLLDIDRAHLGALGVGQHRQVDRAGYMVLGEFAGAAHVDDRAETLQARGVRGFENVDAGHGRPFGIGGPAPYIRAYDSESIGSHPRARASDPPSPTAAAAAASWRRLSCSRS